MENEKPKDGFGSAAFGGKDFPKLFVRRDIEFHSRAIEAKTVPDQEFCVEYMPQHDSVAIAERLEAALSAEKQRGLRAVEEARALAFEEAYVALRTERNSNGVGFTETEEGVHYRRWTGVMLDRMRALRDKAQASRAAKEPS